MKKSPVLYLLVVILISGVLALAWYLVSPLWRVVELHEDSPVDVSTPSLAPATPIAEPMPAKPEILARTPFLPSAHGVAGEALLINTGDQYVVRFENFDTINGPDLRVYLSPNKSDDDIVSLGALKATKGEANYTVPAGTDLNKYEYVLVWCEDFSVLFSYAILHK